MSRGVNKVILVGTAGNDPEVRQLPSGGSVANLSLATNEVWRDKQTGDKQERVSWHRLVFYGPSVDVVSQYVRKGTQLYVEGTIRYSQYESDGVTKYATDIIARDFQMLGSRRSEGQAPSSSSSSSIQDDDIPF